MAEQRRPGRVPLLRRIDYELSVSLEGEQDPPKQGHALSMNVSDAGICLLMEHAPNCKAVLRLHLPISLSSAKTPTLAEVRWVRELPFDSANIHLVGLRFLL